MISLRESGCLNCPAWLNDGRSSKLADNHFTVNKIVPYSVYKSRLVIQGVRFLRVVTYFMKPPSRWRTSNATEGAEKIPNDTLQVREEFASLGPMVVICVFCCISVDATNWSEFFQFSTTLLHGQELIWSILSLVSNACWTHDLREKRETLGRIFAAGLRVYDE